MPRGTSDHMHHRAQLLSSALLVAAVTSSLGCGDPGEPLEMSAVPGAEGYAFNSGLTTQARLVIGDAATWASVWSQITAVDLTPPAAPAIDFDGQLILVAAMGMRPSGGFQITINDVRLVGEFVRISVTEKSPGDGCLVTGAVTDPIDVVAVPRFDGPPTFIEHTSTVDCR